MASFFISILVFASVEAARWDPVFQDKDEALDPDRIRAVFDRHPNMFQFIRPELVVFVRIDWVRYRWTGPTVCSVGDPRLEQESKTGQIQLKPEHQGGGSSKWVFSGMIDRDPCREEG